MLSSWMILPSIRPPHLAPSKTVSPHSVHCFGTGVRRTLEGTEYRQFGFNWSLNHATRIWAAYAGAEARAWPKYLLARPKETDSKDLST